MSSAMDKYPEIAEAWSVYTHCRRQEILRVEKTIGTGKGAMTQVKMVPRTSGYTVLPWEGGVLDQPYRLMAFFDIFAAGESEALKQLVQ